MNGATAWNPAPARAGSRCRHVWAVSGNPCRQSASGPDPASSSPNSRSLARTLVVRNGTEAAMPLRYPRADPAVEKIDRVGPDRPGPAMSVRRPRARHGRLGHARSGGFLAAIASPGLEGQEAAEAENGHRAQ